MLSHRLFIVLVVVCAFSVAGGFVDAARNPPPVFETDYTLPETKTPRHPTAFENATAVAAYAVFLLLAGLAVHYWRSRKMLFGLAIGSVVVLGFWHQGCPCPVGMFQNLVQACVEPSATVAWTVIVLFALPLLAALFFGRIFCSSVCPLGAVQELTAFNNWKVPNHYEQVLGLFRYFTLGIGVFCVVVGLGYVICQFDPFVGIFRHSGLYPVLIFGGVVLVTGFFIGRPFCRFLCPYGALLGMCGSLTAKKVTVTPGKCDQCNLCKSVCPYNAILPPTTEPVPTPLERWARFWQVMVSATLVLPACVLLFLGLGAVIAPQLTMWNQDIRTARLLHAEEEKWVATTGTFPETKGLMQCGTPSEVVYARALKAEKRFKTAGMGLGAWMGLVIGILLVSSVIRRRRTDYEVDPARCFACGRCFWYCPNQKGQRLLLT
ncbi:MAG: 4Fe-4S binding protein [Planctomycetaceae bacterium]|nr:4Fe-4S binding protein [Planctomycetaceae bacterium]